MVYMLDCLYRIIMFVEVLLEEECGDMILSWYKVVKEDSDSEGEEEKVRLVRLYWKIFDYIGGYLGWFQQF